MKKKRRFAKVWLESSGSIGSMSMTSFDCAVEPFSTTTSNKKRNGSNHSRHGLYVNSETTGYSPMTHKRVERLAMSPNTRLDGSPFVKLPRSTQCSVCSRTIPHDPEEADENCCTCLIGFGYRCEECGSFFLTEDLLLRHQQTFENADVPCKSALR